MTHCRLIPLPRETMENSFLRLQQLFTTISTCIDKWRAGNERDASKLWDIMKSSLLEEEYTVCIQKTPAHSSEAISLLAPFFE